MNVIGFATEFYTLWDMQEEPVYFTDNNGAHHLHRIDSKYFYIKNISTDLEKVKALYPNTTIEDGLRGQYRSFTLQSKDDLCPEILKFGKYSGQNIKDLVVSDFSYILWLIGNGSYKIQELCLGLPQVIEYYDNIEKQNKVALELIPKAADGLNKITFTCNPNRTLDIENNAGYNGRWYAAATLGDNHVIRVIIDDIKPVGGMYPYNMAVINGKAMKLKNKTMELNLQIVDTHIYGQSIEQIAIIK